MLRCGVNAAVRQVKVLSLLVFNAAAQKNCLVEIELSTALLYSARTLPLNLNLT